MKTHKGKFLEKVEKKNIIDCIYCGFIHVHPSPSKEEVSRLYQSNYYSNEKPLYIKRNIEDEKWWQSVFKDRLQTIDEFRKTDGKRLLEFGSGPGLFLKYAKKDGWDVIGVEASQIAAEFSKKKGLRIIETLFEDLDTRSLGLFDCVALFEVLEHVAFAKETLVTANKLLKTGGVICLSIPNEYNPLQNVVRQANKIKTYWLVPKIHINYFTIDSISRLLEKCGFKVVYMEATFPMELFILMGDNYLGNDKLGRLVHGRRKRFDILLSKYNNQLKRNFYRSLTELGIGRSITMYARKI